MPLDMGGMPVLRGYARSEEPRRLRWDPSLRLFRACDANRSSLRRLAQRVMAERFAVQLLRRPVIRVKLVLLVRRRGELRVLLRHRVLHGGSGNRARRANARGCTTRVMP